MAALVAEALNSPSVLCIQHLKQVISPLPLNLSVEDSWGTGSFFVSTYSEKKQVDTLPLFAYFKYTGVEKDLNVDSPVNKVQLMHNISAYLLPPLLLQCPRLWLWQCCNAGGRRKD